MSDKKLKPCPFCGSRAESNIVNGYPHVRCTESRRQTEKYLSPCGSNDVWIDMKTWNTRQPNTEQLQIKTAIKLLEDFYAHSRSPQMSIQDTEKCVQKVLKLLKGGE